MDQIDSPLRHYLHILKRQAWLVVLVPAVALAATATFFQLQKPVYRASMTMVVGEPRGEFPPVLGSASLTRTLTNLLESDLVARSVIQTLDLRVSSEELLEKLRVEVLPDTSVLDVSYDSTDPDAALAVVSELAQIFTRELDETLGVRSEGQSRSRPESFDLIVRLFDAPHVEPEPIPRSEATSLGFAGFIGLALGLMLAVARDALDARIRDRKDAEGWFGAPVVGALPKGMRGKPPPGMGKPGRFDHRHQAERVASLDLLRARLEFTQNMGTVGHTLVVTSAGPEEGKSTVAASLAATLARAGKSVVCVDADMRRPSLHRYLGFPKDAPGLADVFKADVELEEVLLTIELGQGDENGAGPSAASGRLEVLPAGTVTTGLNRSLSPQAAAALMEILHERAEYAIFDAPPLLVADAFPLAVQSDSVLVVARRGRTTMGQAESVRVTLEGLGVEHVGIVLTDAPPIDAYA